IGERTSIEVKTNSGERLMKTIDKHRRKMVEEEDRRQVTQKKQNDLLRFFTMLFLIIAATTAGYSLYALYGQIGPLILDLNLANDELSKAVELKDREIEVRKRLELRNRSLI